MIRVPAGEFQLGETDPLIHTRRTEGVVLQTRVRLAEYCIERYPFPGIAGAHHPREGLNHGDAVALDTQLALYGRRLCSISELLLAAAGPDNRRFPWGNEPRTDVCDGSADAPAPLGSHPRCVSSLGVHDFAVRSAFARLGPRLRAHLRTTGAPIAPPHTGLGRIDEATFVVYGGSANPLSYYAPNNFGIHAHAPEGTVRYLDDSARVCADPRGEFREDQYRAFLERFMLTGRFSDLLRSDDAVGAPEATRF